MVKLQSDNFKNADALGIIAGSGKLPLEIAQIYSTSGKKCYIAALDPETNFNAAGLFPSESFQMGQVGSIMDFFHKAGVKNIIMVGSIARPDLRSIRVDFQGSKLLATIMKKRILSKGKIFGDDYILKLVSEFLEKNDFKVISPAEVLKLTDYDSSMVAVNYPNQKDEHDIELGRKVLLATGELDIGQAVVVCDGYVLGLEAAEGTDNLIKRCGILKKKKKGGVLVKMSKISQDMRLDIPTIGPDTIFYLAENGFSGVAIERKKVMIVDPEETKNLAAKNNIFISFV